MKLENTINYFFKNCSKRIDTRIKKKGLYHYGVYPSDEKMISRIVKCTLGKNNKYLLTKAVMRDSDNLYGLIPRLEFKDEREVLWGKDEEIANNLPDIFFNLICDLLPCCSDYGINIDNILSDYIPYAKYFTYQQVIEHSKLSPLIYYGIREDTLASEMLDAKERAIDFLYSKPECKGIFAKLFNKFTKETLTYTKIDKVLDEKFVRPFFIPLLKKYIPTNDSLGLRVKNLVESDMSKSKDLILNHQIGRETDSSEMIKRLIHASSVYIIELEAIQKDYINTISFKY